MLYLTALLLFFFITPLAPFFLFFTEFTASLHGHLFVQICCQLCALRRWLLSLRPEIDIKIAAPAGLAGAAYYFSMLSPDISQQLLCRISQVHHQVKHCLQSSSSLRSGTLRYIPDRMQKGYLNQVFLHLHST